ncbi:phage/plasmid replication domain-containing protein [Paraburkholderia phenoliruptrix]|uniref:phage/plasmid replication domain-containing protein n=1 Tax=Paraburkholderia phenoliruptrix TaxID=252970 RepID=UPI003D98E9FA
MKTRPTQNASPPLKPIAEKLAKIGMAFRPTDRVHFDTIKFAVSGIEWDVSGQTSCMVSDGDGVLLFDRTNRLPVSGKFGMHALQVRYSPTKKMLYVEGSLFGFILGQNVFTSQRLAKGLARVISNLKKKLGFSFAVPMQKLIDEHVTLHRVDMAVNLTFGSGRFVKTCLRQIVRQLIEQDCSVRKAFTSVYWTPQDSRYYSLIFYDKGEDIRRRYLAKAKRTGDKEQKFYEALCDECDGLLRIEVRLKSAELKKRGLRNVKAWSGDAPKEIFNRYYRNVPILNVVSSGMSRVDFHGVPDRLRPVIALRKLNAPMELVYSDRTMARHRATFRKLKIDLTSPARAKVVPLAKVLTASRIKPTPTRLIDAQFAPLPCEASELPSPVKGRVSRIA